MDLINLLETISVINRDNGKRFTNSERLDVIASILWDSRYRKINSDGLFNLYAKHPVDSYQGNKVVIVSSHVDCQSSITRCFSKQMGNGLLKGTYDNSITNTAILSLMMSDVIPDNVLIAFTGDEEEESHGAKHLIRFLESKSISIRHLFVLDVTDMGWDESVDFTVENNFWQDDYGEKIVNAVCNSSYAWKFVPSYPDRVPGFVPKKNVIRIEAEPDESWHYDDEGINCCSFCLPTKGEMHSDEGVYARESSFRAYTEMLNKLLHIS